MKVARVLAENVTALLKRHRYSQHDLAQWCGHSDAWASQFFTSKRGWRLDDLDRIADLFGLEPYQLFQPGVAACTERRSQNERRSAKDRRTSPGVRAMLPTSLEIDAHRPQRKELTDVAAVSPAILELVGSLERDFQRLLATLSPKPRREAAPARQTQPATRPRVRNPRESDTGNASAEK